MKVTEIEERGRRELKPIQKRGGKAAKPWGGPGLGEFGRMDLFEEGANRRTEETMHEKVLNLIDQAYEGLLKNCSKATVADLARLMQLERELRPQGCERMVVEWVDALREA